MGYKLWSTSELLTSSDLNGYLMKQSVISCTSGTRPSSPPDGMLIWETDTERYTSWNATLGAWVPLVQMVTGTYTPTLTGSTTNPNLGSTGLIEGRYVVFGGKWCVYRGSAQWGGTGVTAGSGQYLISLPFTSSPQIGNGVSNLGTIMMRDFSAGPALATGVCYITTSQTTMGLFATTTGTVTNAVPWTWGGVSDYISWDITYEIT